MRGKKSGTPKRPVVQDFSGLAPTRPLVRLVVDEMLGDSAVTVATASGAELFFMQQLMPGASDDEVAKFADVKRAIVVTLNVRHFHSLLARSLHGEHRRYRHAGLIALVCQPPRVAQRLEATWDFIMSEVALADRRRDKRLFVEIADDYAKTFR